MRHMKGILGFNVPLRRAVRFPGLFSVRHASRHRLTAMCMQCMATAMSATATAAGTRAYIAQKHFAWVTPKRLHRITVVLIAAALLASGLVASGSSTPPHSGSTSAKTEHLR